MAGLHPNESRMKMSRPGATLTAPNGGVYVGEFVAGAASAAA